MTVNATRRSMLAAIPAQAERNYNRGAAPVRYPDADIVAIDRARGARAGWAIQCAE